MKERAVPFTRPLIAQNRELFEMLAQRSFHPSSASQQ
jgi:hypothetical protein